MGKISVLHMPIIQHFGGIDLYKMGRNLDSSDLTELQEIYDRATTVLHLRVQITSDGMVKEKCLWQEFRGMEHIVYLIT